MSNFKSVMLAALVCTATLSAYSQVQNMALQLEPGGYVECGQLPSIDNLSSYTIQLWYCGHAASETEPGILMRRGNDADEMLMVSENGGNVTFAIGSTSITAPASMLSADTWHQLTLICDNGAARLLVDGNEGAKGSLSAIPAAPEAYLYLGSGSFAGRIDDVRIWNDVLIPDYDYYINTTLNEYNPQVENLVVYYKLDQADCPDVVNYKSIWSKESYSPNHGIMSEQGAQKVKVEDNARLPYLINSAYTANERFWDRVVSEGQYKVSNDIIILGIQSMNDGHLKYVTPVCHGEITNCKHLDEFEGRNGVLQFNGEGSKMVTNKDAFQPDATKGYTFETYFYIDEWIEGATIFKKETEDKAHGFAIYLGSQESQSLVLRVNGKEYTRKLSNTQKQGSWVHLAICPNIGTSQAKQSFIFIVNGNSLSASTDPGVVECMPTGADDCEVVIGENFKGKLDETATWKKNFTLTEITNHMRGLPMPKIGGSVTAEPMFNALSYYKYDMPENPGWDYYSQDHWLKIIEGAYEGYTGYNVRISVKSHQGWQTTIENQTRRKRFAIDLAELSKPYAGVELDLEWAETTYQMSNLAALCKEIRNQLPEGKQFFLSCHCYASTYKVPTDYMQYLDGFTFQVYGPQNTWFKWDSFVNCYNTFVNWGFPKDKIMMAYSTTTSGGYKDGKMSTSIIKGVKDGFMPDNYVPNDTEECATFNGLDYWFIGTKQIYRRAKFCVDNNLQGIFYWDMGNDMPFNSGKNLARISSYAMCGNVDPYVAKVEREYNGIVAPLVCTKSNAASISMQGNVLTAKFLSGETIDTISLYSIEGKLVSQARQSEMNVGYLPAGIYIAQAVSKSGAIASTKLSIK